MAVLYSEEKGRSTTETKNTLVIAPPGCGKTWSLANSLLEVEDRNSVLCLTFTQQAAREMKDKVRRLGINIYESALESNICTLHSFCYNRLSYNKSIIDPDSDLGRTISNKLFSKNNLRLNSLNRLQDISFRLQIIEEFVELKGQIRKPRINDSIKRQLEQYRQFKEEIDAKDYGDLLVDYYKLINKQALEQYKLVLVDEVQDLNILEIEIIKKLVDKDEGRIIFYGDPRQSIYSFQGADLKVLGDLASKCEHSTLSDNRRAHQCIVDFTEAFFAKRLKRQKCLQPFKVDQQTGLTQTPPEWLNILFSSTRLQERKELMRFIDTLPRGESVAILARYNDSVDELVNHLTTQHKYFVYNPGNEVHWGYLNTLAYHLRLCGDPENQKWWKLLLCSFWQHQEESSFLTELEEKKILVSDIALYEEGCSSSHFCDTVNSKDYVLIGYDNRVVSIVEDSENSESKEFTNVPKEQLLDIINMYSGRNVILYCPGLESADRWHLKQNFETTNRNRLLIDFCQILYLWDAPEKESEGNILNKVKKAADYFDKIKDKQSKFLESDAIKNVRRELVNGYRHIFYIQTSSLYSIDFTATNEDCADNSEGRKSNNWAPILKVIDWLRAALVKLEKSHLISVPKFNLDKMVFHQTGKEAKLWAQSQNKDLSKPDSIGVICSIITNLDKVALLKSAKLPIRTVFAMTIHQSKGLEFDNILMYNSTAAEYKQYPENDRIYYVGLTRASKRIVISYSDSFVPVKERGRKKGLFPKQIKDERQSTIIHWPKRILSGKKRTRASQKPSDVISEMMSEICTSYSMQETPSIENGGAFNGILEIGNHSFNFIGRVNAKGQESEIDSISISVDQPLQ